MVACVGLVDDIGDLVFFIDDESDTIGYADSGFGREQQPAAGDSTVGLCHRPFGVGGQWKVELVFLTEQRTRHYLLKRHHELEPPFVRHGIMLDIDALKDRTRTLDRKLHGSRQHQDEKLRSVALDLADTLADLQRWGKTQKVT